MTIAVADIDRRLNFILNDKDRVRWTLDERCAWINDAAKEIVNVRPAAGADTVELTLAEGILQAIPADAFLLMDVVRNITAAGKPGRPVRRADRDMLDSQDPEWYARKAGDVLKHYTYDDRNPKHFYAYPPVKADVKIEALVAKAPADVSAEGDDLAIDALYIGPVVSYVAWRALQKDSEFANGAIAGQHLQAFMSALGIKDQKSLMAGPKGVLNEKP